MSLLKRWNGTNWEVIAGASAAGVSVVAETSFGQASAVGTSTTFARSDHTHGTPATPVTSAVAGTGIAVSGATGAVTISVAQLTTGLTNAAALTTYADLVAHSGYVTTANGWPVNGFLSGFRNGTVGTQRLQAETTGSTYSRYWINGSSAWSAWSLYTDAQDYTAKGSILAATASNAYAEVTVGANGTVLVANSAATAGVNWRTLTAADVAAGTFPAGNYVAQGTVTATAFSASGLTGATAGVRFVGATTANAPASGTFLDGDIILDRTKRIFYQADGLGGFNPMFLSYFTTNSLNYTASQTFSAGLTIPSGQALTTGTRTVVTGTRSVTTNASDTVDLGVFASTGGAIELRIHAHLVAGVAGATASVTKVYEFATSALMGTVSTWYLLLPVDASANAAATNDFALEVQRTATGSFSFRFRQKSIALAGTITFTVETLGDTAVTFTPSTTVTAAPAAVSTVHPSNSLVVAAGNVGIGTDAPATQFHIMGGGAAGLSDGSGFMQIGPSGSTNTGYGTARIQARAGDNATGAQFSINPLGGAVQIASAAAAIYLGTADAAHDINGAWVAYAPTLTNTTGATVTARYKLLGAKTMLLRFEFTAGTVTLSGNVTMTLPSGITALSGAGKQVTVGINTTNTTNSTPGSIGAGTTTVAWPGTATAALATLIGAQFATVEIA